MRPRPAVARVLCIVVGIIVLLFAALAWLGSAAYYGEGMESVPWQDSVWIVALFCLGACALVAAGMTSSSPLQARRLASFTAAAGFPAMLLTTGFDPVAVGIALLYWAGPAALLFLAGRLTPVALAPTEHIGGGGAN